MRPLSVVALPLVGLLALPGSAPTQNTPAGAVASPAALQMQADRLVAVQSELGLQVDPYNIAVMSIGLPGSAGVVNARL